MKKSNSQRKGVNVYKDVMNYAANADRYDTDELVAILYFGKGLLDTYKNFGMEAPQALKDNVAAIEKDVRARRRDNIERALKQARLRKDSLKTQEEKRKDLDSEIERLELELSGNTA